MTVRTFGVAGDGATPVVHDPATGLTHRAPVPIASGRTRLDDRAAGGWPIVTPRDLDRAAPLSICWSPLVRCNLRCPHCLDDKSLPEEDRSRRLELAGLIAGCGVLGVDVSGGEPLLLRELSELLTRLTSGGRCVASVTTNGWMLARRAEHLVGRADAVRVSLDGPDGAAHDRWRGPGSFTRAVEGIRACQRAGIPVQVQTVLMASTRHLAQAMVDLAAGEGAHGLTFLQMLPIGEGARLADREVLSDADARALVAGLRIPPGLRVRLRERRAADGFTVLRADGTIWRNRRGATQIDPGRRVRSPQHLALDAPDGSA